MIPKLGVHTPLVSSHTLVAKPAPSVTNPPEGPMSPSHARSSLAALDQPPPLSKPADPIPTVTHQSGTAAPTSANPGSLVSSGVPAPPCLHLASISDSSTAPVSMISGSLLLSVVSAPPCPGPVGISGPSTAPASMIPSSLVSSTVALPLPSVISAASTSVPGQTHVAPALISCPPAPPNSGAMSPSYMHTNGLPNRFPGSVAFSPLTVLPARHRHVTTPVPSHVASHPPTVDRTPSSNASLSLLQSTGLPIHSLSHDHTQLDTPTRNCYTTPSRDYTRRVSYSGSGRLGLGHSGMGHSVPSGSSSRITVNPQATLPELHLVEPMALDSNEISLTSDEFVYVGNDDWHENVGGGA
ncbi:hypothetical protein FRC11_012933 [Ceratobasidium sp. 423]|nr:hypothetical protein FRC11_012933 [Ceratobasidium sp. 423]